MTASYVFWGAVIGLAARSLLSLGVIGGRGCEEVQDSSS